MAWLFFMDESGHDHQDTPFEVRGGFALEDKNLWPFVQAVHQLEKSCFGARLADFGKEIKGSNLLSTKRFKHARQTCVFDEDKRPQLSRAFLQAGVEIRPPSREQFTAYGQASLSMVDGIFDLLDKHHAVIFASAVPRDTTYPATTQPPVDFLRKDHIFLLERFFYFLENPRQMGLLIMDEVEKTQDRRFVKSLHDYFVKTDKGRERSRWIVPSPFFVASDMALPVQVADVIIYIINWGYRVPFPMKRTPARTEIETRYEKRIQNLNWKGEGFDGINAFKSYGIFCVPDLYASRD